MTKQSTNTPLQSLHALIANDAYTMTFQSLPQYRTALLQRLAAFANQPSPTDWEAAHTDMVKRNALLRERPDLPVDRIPAHAELMRLQEENARLRANEQAPTLPVAWRDALRRSGATDHHGRIAFLPAQLEHFVSMLTAHQPAQEQAEPTTAEPVHALRQAERLLRAAGFAMTGTASSQIVAAIAAHAAAAQHDGGQGEGD